MYYHKIVLFRHKKTLLTVLQAQNKPITTAVRAFFLQTGTTSLSLNHAQALQIIHGGFENESEPCARQVDGANEFTAHCPYHQLRRE